MNEPYTVEADTTLRRLGEQGERTRSKILEATAAALKQRGYAAVRIDDITKEAGCSHGAFYLYFKNKDEAVVALAESTAEQMLALGERFPNSTEFASFDALRAWVNDFVVTSEANAAIVDAWMNAKDGGGQLGALGRDLLARFAHTIAARIPPIPGRAGDLDPLHVTVALILMLERVCFFTIHVGSPDDRDATIDALATIWFRSLSDR